MKSFIIILVAVLALSSSCGSTKTQQLPNFNDEVEYQERSIRYFENGKIQKFKLSKPTQIGDYTCMRWVHFFENGDIYMMQTAADIPMKHFTIPANSFVFFDHDSGYINQVWLSRNTKIQDVMCKGRGKVTTSFYPNGNLKSCFTKENTYIQGYPCMGGLFENLQFHGDGKLKAFTISKDTNYRNTKISKGTRLLIQPGKKLQLIDHK